MDLLTQLFIKALEGQKVEVHFADPGFSLRDEIESASLAALRQIRDILADDSLADAECFKQIEAVVCVFEGLGIDCGNRHDFG